MEKRYEELVLTKEDFKDDLWKQVGLTLELLCKAGYECEVYEEEAGIIVIHYNHNSNKAHGNGTIYWLTPEEAEQIEEI